MCCHISFLEDLSASCLTPLGLETLEASVWFPLDFALCAFFFSDFALSSFAVRNFSHEYDYLLSTGSSSSKPWKLGVVLVTPDTPDIWESCPLHKTNSNGIDPKGRGNQFFEIAFFKNVQVKLSYKIPKGFSVFDE